MINLFSMASSAMLTICWQTIASQAAAIKKFVIRFLQALFLRALPRPKLYFQSSAFMDFQRAEIGSVVTYKMDFTRISKGLLGEKM